MLRLFIGISLPTDLCRRLQLLQGGIPGARWTHPQDYHITLSFIGDVDEGTAEDIDEALSSLRVPAFDLVLKGMGTFSRGEMTGYLWAGVEHCDALHFLKEKIDHALVAYKIPFEKRKYTPHVTLARLKNSDDDKIGEFIQQHNLFNSAPFAVDSFILYRSHASHEGPLYEELVEYPLAQSMTAQIS